MSQNPRCPGPRRSARPPRPCNRARHRRTLAGSDITFSWQDYFDTNQATAWHGESWQPVGPEVPHSGRHRAVVLGARGHPRRRPGDLHRVRKLYPEGTLYWRVQALDAAGNGLTWSRRSAPSSSPARRWPRVAPVNGSAVAGTTPFTWQAQPFARRTRSRSTRTTTRRSPPPTGCSPPHQDLVLRLGQAVPRRPDALHLAGAPDRLHGQPRAVVDAGALHLARRHPARCGPGQRRVAADGRPAVRVDRGHRSGDLRPRGPGAGRDVQLPRVATAATAHAPVQAIATGYYTWRVSALDATGTSLGTSATRGFRVDATPPTIKKIKPESRKLKPSPWSPWSSPRRSMDVTKKTLFITPEGKKKPLKAKVKLNSKGPRPSSTPSRASSPAPTSSTRRPRSRTCRGNPLSGGEKPVIRP